MKKATDFASKKEFLAYLFANKAELAELKKAPRKFTDPYGIGMFVERTVKALNTSFVDNPESGSIDRSIILNTYNWLDSHKDVHLDHLFKNSIKERKDRIWHLHDHRFEVSAKVGKPKKVYEKAVAWIDLGIEKPGETMCLFMDTQIMREWNEKIFLQYLADEIKQHSVAMQYVQLDLALNDPDYKQEFRLWNKILPLLGNPDEAEKDGFFWAISEAKLFEGSCVLEGSNELTPTLPNTPGTESDKSKKVEAAKSSFYDSFVKAMHAHRV